MLPGVDVTVTQTETGLTRSAVTDATGSYTLPNLPVGPYRLEASLSGFRTYVQTRHRADGQRHTRRQRRARARRAVRADHGDRQRGDGGDAQHRRRAAHREPARARAAAQRPAGDRPALLSPARDDQHDRRLRVEPQLSHGADLGGRRLARQHRLHHGRRQPQRSRHNFNLPVPFPDALQEFKIETSALAARYGHHAAAVVNVVTKSGTNDSTAASSSSSATAGSMPRTRSRCRRTRCAATSSAAPSAVRSRRTGSSSSAGIRARIIKTDPSTLQAFVPTADMLRGDFTAVASPACNAGRQVTLRAPFVNNRMSPGAVRSRRAAATSSSFRSRPIHAAAISTAIRRRAPTIRSSAASTTSTARGTRSTAATWTSTTSCRTTSTGRTR